MENSTQDHLTNMDLHIDNQVNQQLNESAKWAKFISIVMFISCGILLIFGLIGGAFLNDVFRRLGRGYGNESFMNGGVLIVLILFIVAVLGVVYYFLFIFSQKIKNALVRENTPELNAGLKSLKIFFILTGVLSILSLLINLLNLIK